MNRYRFKHIALAVLLLPCACTSQLDSVRDGEQALRFSSNTVDCQIVSDTKATLYSSNVVANFNVKGFDSSLGQWFPKTGDAQAVTTGQVYNNYKWSGSAQYTFYAYANLPSDSGASASVANDGVTLTVTDITKQQDILLGRSQCSCGTAGVANVVFCHPFASVQFKIGTFSHVTSIKSISVKGVSNGGITTLNMSNTETTYGSIKAAVFTWNSLSGDATITQDYSSSPLTPVNGQTVGEPFIIIPQTFSEETPLTVTLSLVLESGEEATVSGSLAPAVPAGVTTLCSVSYSAGEALKFGWEWTVTGWNSTSKDVSFF